VQLLVNRQTPPPKKALAQSDFVQHWMLSAVPGHKPLVEVPPFALQLEVEMHTPTPEARPPPEQAPFTTDAWVEAIETRRTDKENNFMADATRRVKSMGYQIIWFGEA
jgi:hypothetical protein